METIGTTGDLQAPTEAEPTTTSANSLHDINFSDQAWFRDLIILLLLQISWLSATVLVLSRRSKAGGLLYLLLGLFNLILVIIPMSVFLFAVYFPAVLNIQMSEFSQRSLPSWLARFAKWHDLSSNRFSWRRILAMSFLVASINACALVILHGVKSSLGDIFADIFDNFLVFLVILGTVGGIPRDTMGPCGLYSIVEEEETIVLY